MPGPNSSDTSLTATTLPNHFDTLSTTMVVSEEDSALLSTVASSVLMPHIFDSATT